MMGIVKVTGLTCFKPPVRYFSQRWLRHWSHPNQVSRLLVEYLVSFMKRIPKCPLEEISFWNLESQITLTAHFAIHQLRLKVVILADQKPVVPNPNVDILHTAPSFFAINYVGTTYCFEVV